MSVVHAEVESIGAMRHTSARQFLGEMRPFGSIWRRLPNLWLRTQSGPHAPNGIVRLADLGLDHADAKGTHVAKPWPTLWLRPCDGPRARSGAAADSRDCAASPRSILVAVGCD